MATQIFVSLPTSDLERAKAFYTGVGWPLNPQLSDDNGACFVVSEHIYLMIVAREFLATFTDKPIVDPSTMLQTQTGLSADSREEVDAIIERAIAAGGREDREAQDYGFMYSRDFEDPDGNHFGIIWSDPTASDSGQGASAGQQSQGT